MGKKKKRFKKLKKKLEYFFDIKLDGVDLEVCDCEDMQVCDVCQEYDKHNPPKDVEPVNKGHYFEVMDRVHIIQCNIDDFVNEHPAIDKPGIEEALIKRQIEEVQDLLTEVYQWSSGKWDDFDK